MLVSFLTKINAHLKSHEVICLSYLWFYLEALPCLQMTLCTKCKEMIKHLKYCKHLAHGLAREQVKYCPFRLVSSMSLIFSRCLGVVRLLAQHKMIWFTGDHREGKQTLICLGTTRGYQWHQLGKDR